jgi:release factor glutamine methyltransferase
MRLSINSKRMRELVRNVSKQLEINRSEAELVIAALLNRPRFELYTKDTIGASDEAVLWSRIDQLRHGTPIEYVTQRVQFREHALKIMPGVFIPRSETEYFVELIPYVIPSAPRRILEIGTGCGAISVALAHRYPDAEIVATDISRLALGNALENAREQNLHSRLNFIQGDMYDAIAGTFDLIVSNPPYVPSERMSELPESVRGFEPLNAIDGGQHGVQFIERLVSEGIKRLSGPGVMALEIDEESTDILKEFLDAHGIRKFRFCKDLFKRYRYLFIGDIDEES